MEELKLAVASNIIKLRTGAGMTQAELGEKLNYSDKTISKWERAESMPDAFVLKQLAELFHVSVDYLLNTHDQWERPQENEGAAFRQYSSDAITLVSITGIWTIAFLVFVILWLFGTIWWEIFAYAVPLSLVALLVFNSIWNGGKYNSYIVAALVFCVIAVAYIVLRRHNPWQLFLVAAPAELLVFLSFRIRKRDKKP